MPDSFSWAVAAGMHRLLLFGPLMSGPLYRKTVQIKKLDLGSNEPQPFYPKPFRMFKYLTPRPEPQASYTRPFRTFMNVLNGLDEKACGLGLWDKYFASGDYTLHDRVQGTELRVHNLLFLVYGLWLRFES